MLSLKKLLKVRERLRNTPHPTPPERFSGGLWVGTHMNWHVLLLVLRLKQAMTSLLDLDLQLEQISVSLSTEHCCINLGW